jgi:hypothetical protein
VYCSLILVPLRWSQQIRSFPTLFGEEEGGYLVSICRPSDCDLRLKNGLFVRDFELQFSIIRGKLDDERRQKFRLPATAIGGLWFHEKEEMIHGWLNLAAVNFSTLWEQVTAGGYERCSIQLMGEGADDSDPELWSGTLSINDANITFERRAAPDDLKRQTSQGGLFQRRR